MECQKIINLLDNTPNEPSKFRTKNWFEINDDANSITPIVTLNLKLQCWSQVFVIIVMRTYLWVEL